MSLGVDTLAVLPYLRSQAESRMTETVSSVSIVITVDPNTLVTTETPTTHYAGIARVKYPTITVSDREVAGQQIAFQDIIVSVPVGSAIVEPGQTFIVSASIADASLIGREYRVKAAPQAGQVTALRYPVEELS